MKESRPTQRHREPSRADFIVSFRHTADLPPENGSRFNVRPMRLALHLDQFLGGRSGEDGTDLVVLHLLVGGVVASVDLVEDLVHTTGHLDATSGVPGL